MNAPPFRIKICGVTDEQILPVIANQGGDAIGLNFFPSSIRYLAPSAAKRIARQASGLGLLTVGVFVDTAESDLAQIAAECDLDIVQLHGDYSEEFTAALLARRVRVIRVVRLPTGPLRPEEIESLVAPWRRLGCSLLLDAESGGHFGGQGNRLDWDSLASWEYSMGRIDGHDVPARASEQRVSSHRRSSWTLAGGLDPLNVAEAIQRTGASSVDVASGVELPRGEKNSVLVAAFIEAALRAWRSEGGGD